MGERLAFLALANDYGVTGLPAPAPVYKSMERDGNKLVLTFDNLPVRAQNGVDSFVAFGLMVIAVRAVSRLRAKTGFSTLPLRISNIGTTGSK